VEKNPTWILINEKVRKIIMNFRTLPEHDLASFAENLVDLLTGSELAAIDPAVRTDLVTAIGTLPATLRIKADSADVIEGQRKAAVSERDAATAMLHIVIGQVKSALKTGLAPKKEYDLCNFDFPDTSRSRYIAEDPTELSVTGFSNGITKGAFVGNNTRGNVVYDVWRREGDDGPWAAHTVTRKQTFKDTGVTPGQYYEYRVRAIGSTSISDWSNSAIVYGVL
jgi:hypothetical protein